MRLRLSEIPGGVLLNTLYYGDNLHILREHDHIPTESVDLIYLDPPFNGEPLDLSSARQLADGNRYQFQWWALSLIKARPLGGSESGQEGKKGRDKGIDGIITFIDDQTGKAKRSIVQVKSGKATSAHIRDLKGTLDREKAEMGVFLSLESPTRDMKTEAASAGFYSSPGWGRDFPRVQILTIEELLEGAEVKMPPSVHTATTFKQAEKVRGKQKEKQQEIFQSPNG